MCSVASAFVPNLNHSQIVVASRHCAYVPDRKFKISYRLYVLGGWTAMNELSSVIKHIQVHPDCVVDVKNYLPNPLLDTSVDKFHLEDFLIQTYFVISNEDDLDVLKQLELRPRECLAFKKYAKVKLDDLYCFHLERKHTSNRAFLVISATAVTQKSSSLHCATNLAATFKTAIGVFPSEFRAVVAHLLLEESQVSHESPSEVQINQPSNALTITTTYSRVPPNLMMKGSTRDVMADLDGILRVKHDPFCKGTQYAQTSSLGLVIVCDACDIYHKGKNLFGVVPKKGAVEWWGWDTRLTRWTVEKHFVEYFCMMTMVAYYEQAQQEHDPDFKDKLDGNPALIGFTNGVYDLDANEFHPANPSDYITMSCGYAFEREVNHVVRAEIDNKSAIADAMKYALGDYFTTIKSTLLTEKQGASAAALPDLMDLMKRRLAIASEPEKGKTINTGFMKRLTGNDDIVACQLYEEMVTFKPSHATGLLTNDIPPMDQTDAAVKARVVVVPFQTTFVVVVTQPNHRLMDEQLKKGLKKWGPQLMLHLIEWHTWYRSEACDPRR
ncbi:hypothetical protein BJ741DRAFT_653829 [Chytriomyces cf. hyalinus JEL632]|nr:hypothetical protein BJ741DRAFT_653829 [Chytriomyces cf. hyalinus JEL632]